MYSTLYLNTTRNKMKKFNALFESITDTYISESISILTKQFSLNESLENEDNSFIQESKLHILKHGKDKFNTDYTLVKEGFLDKVKSLFSKDKEKDQKVQKYSKELDNIKSAIYDWFTTIDTELAQIKRDITLAKNKSDEKILDDKLMKEFKDALSFAISNSGHNNQNTLIADTLVNLRKYDKTITYESILSKIDKIINTAKLTSKSSLGNLVSEIVGQALFLARNTKNKDASNSLKIDSKFSTTDIFALLMTIQALPHVLRILQKKHKEVTPYVNILAPHDKGTNSIFKINKN